MEKSSGSCSGLSGGPKSPSTASRKMKRTKGQVCILKEKQQQD